MRVSGVLGGGGPGFGLAGELGLVVRRLGLRILALGLGLLVVSSCVGGKSQQGPTVQLIAATYRPTGEEVITTRKDQPARFFSRDNLRDTYFSGNAVPRLAGDGGGDYGRGLPQLLRGRLEHRHNVNGDRHVDSQCGQVVGGYWVQDAPIHKRSTAMHHRLEYAWNR